MNVLSFGEILWDVYPNSKCLGGAPLNFAAHLAKHGENVCMMSAVGKDALGEEAKKYIKEWGISAKYISSLDDKSTGRCMVTLDENKVPSYNLLQNVAYDYIACDKVTDSFDVLYFGTLALRTENNYCLINRLLKTNEFKNVFVDINIRPPFYSEKSVCFSIQNAAILKISLEELPVVSEILKTKKSIGYKEFAVKLAAMYDNLKCIIITLGSEGAYALDCIADKEYTCDCEKVKVKSTVGAGDSFSAAFLHKYMKDNEIPVCLRYAVKVAGFVVSEYDAVPDYKIEDFA